MDDLTSIPIKTWRPKIIEGECQYSEENLDATLAKVKSLLQEHSCSSVSIRRINDSLVLKFIA